MIWQLAVLKCLTYKMDCYIIAFMNEATAASHLYTSEAEPFPRHNILMLGGGHGTGLIIAQRLAMEGYRIHIGTRTDQSFNLARQSILGMGGVEPSGFIADLTDQESIENALRRSDIQPGQTVHYFDFAAAGFESLLRPLARPLGELKRAFERGLLNPELATRLTQDIRTIVTADKAFLLANRVNRDAPYELGQMLAQNRNLVPGSVIATLSSVISNYTNPGSPEDYPGPWLYYPIGVSKAEGVWRMQALTQQTGAKHVDFVAPEIERTDVIRLFENILPYLQALQPNIPLTISSVTKDQVADAVFWELTRTDIQPFLSRTVYVTPTGPTFQRPEDWKIPVIPYL